MHIHKMFSSYLLESRWRRALQTVGGVVYSLHDLRRQPHGIGGWREPLCVGRCWSEEGPPISGILGFYFSLKIHNIIIWTIIKYLNNYNNSIVHRTPMHFMTEILKLSPMKAWVIWVIWKVVWPQRATSQGDHYLRSTCTSHRISWKFSQAHSSSCLNI